MTSVTYGEFDHALQGAGSGVEAAEAHGCLSGALCVEAAFPVAEWAAEILPHEAGEPVAPGLLDLLAVVRDATVAALSGGEMAFEPMLPDDSGSLDERVNALAGWCSGFLYGLGRGGTLKELPGDLGEVLNDFSEISRATIDGDEAGEQAERDYTELVEFVRASVLLAWEELAPQRAGPSSPGTQKH
jgi:uncharacterized protein YgfB (UPF0149 family)